MSFDEQAVIDRWWNIKNGDYVIDCGCATGEYTVSALDKGAGFVYAFDADLEAYRATKLRVTEIGGEDRCNVYFKGVWDEPRLCYSLVQAWESIGIPRTFTEPIIGYHSVDFCRLDDMDFNKVNWIKIDVEGFELKVLEGAKDMLKRFHPKLIIENHSKVDHIKPYMKRYDIWAQILDLLQSFAYIVEEVPHEGRSHLYAS